MLPNENKIYIGYHGTNADHVECILKQGFRISDKTDEWLGHGIYFFTEGISEPIEDAKEWAMNQAWDKGAKEYSYQNYAVLKAEISGERVLDLTTTEGLRVYNETRNLLICKYESYFDKNRKIHEDNCKMSNLIIKQHKLDILIASLYIKNRDQRIKKIDSNIPNTTVMLVAKPQNVLSIKVISTGEIT